jgi:hypothetical protein
VLTKLGRPGNNPRRLEGRGEGTGHPRR